MEEKMRLKIIKCAYIVCYALIAVFIIYMQHNVWKLSSRKYLLVMIGYLLLAFITRLLIKKINKND